MLPAEFSDLGAASRRIVEKAIALGLSVTREGAAWRFRGVGVDVSVTRPALLSQADLRPPLPNQRHRRH